MKPIFVALLTLSSSLIFFASCDSGSSSSGSSEAAGSNNILNASIDPALEPYFNEFLLEADRRGIPLNGARLSALTLQFGELDAGTLGICSANNTSNDIVISNLATAAQLRWVVAHELGHCILRMNHREDTISIMNGALRIAVLNSLDPQIVFDEFFQEQFFEAF